MRKKILIRGGGFANKGAEAMLLCAKMEMLKKYPDAEIYMTNTTGSIEHAKSVGIIVIKARRSIFQRVFYAALRRIPLVREPFITRHKRANITQSEIRQLSHLDLILDISGFAYGDDWNGVYLAQTIEWMESFPNTPYYLFPQAFGPFEDESYNNRYRDMFHKAAGVWARDTASRDYLERLFDESPAAIVNYSPDIALNFKKGSIAAGKAFLEGSFGLHMKDRQVIVVSPNRQVYLRTQGEGTKNSYIQLLRDIIGDFLAQGVAVVLLSNEINEKNPINSDDRMIVSLLHGMFGPSDAVYSCNDWLSAAQAQSILMNADFVIASRYHTAILAISAAKPVFTLGWSHKYFELMNLFQLESYSMDPRLDDANEIRSRLMVAYDNRENVVQSLKSNLPSVRSVIDGFWTQIC